MTVSEVGATGLLSSAAWGVAHYPFLLFVINFIMVLENNTNYKVRFVLAG